MLELKIRYLIFYLEKNKTKQKLKQNKNQNNRISPNHILHLRTQRKPAKPGHFTLVLEALWVCFQVCCHVKALITSTWRWEGGRVSEMHCKNSSLKITWAELLLQKATLAAPVSTAKPSFVLDELPKELFSVQCWCAAEQESGGTSPRGCWHETAPGISARNTFLPKNCCKGAGIICPVFESLCKWSPAPITRVLQSQIKQEDVFGEIIAGPGKSSFPFFVWFRITMHSKLHILCSIPDRLLLRFRCYSLSRNAQKSRGKKVNTCNKCLTKEFISKMSICNLQNHWRTGKQWFRESWSSQISPLHNSLFSQIRRKSM